MIVLYRIVTLAILLGIIVLVHELGHYIAARLMGVRVETFSFGFGRRIFGKKIGDTDFRLSLIPLGGYVKMAGEEDYENRDPKPDEFLAKNRAQKIFILIMGPLMNVVLAFIILTIIYMTGINVPEYHLEAPVVGHIHKNSPGESAGIQIGDRILAIDGKEIKNWKEFEWQVRANPNETIEITLERSGKILDTSLTVIEANQLGESGIDYPFLTRIDDVLPGGPADNAGIQKGDIIERINGVPVNIFTLSSILVSSTGKPLKLEIRRKNELSTVTLIPYQAAGADLRIGPLDIKVGLKPHKGESAVRSFHLKSDGLIGISRGIFYPMKEDKMAFSDAASKSARELLNLSFLVVKVVKKMIQGKMDPKSMSGPLEIAKISQKVMDTGLTNFFMLVAFISLQLGIINLFPIPALDGGHLLIYSVESIIRRDLPPKVKNFLMNLGFLILILLMAFVILNDIAKELPNGWKTFLP